MTTRTTAARIAAPILDIFAGFGYAFRYLRAYKDLQDVRSLDAERLRDAGLTRKQVDAMTMSDFVKAPYQK